MPTLTMPPTVEVDPTADIVHVELRLSAPPTTTAIVEVVTANGDGPQLAWEGGQFQRLSTLVVFPAGGPQARSVAVTLKPSAANTGRHFFLVTPQVEHPGLSPGPGRTLIRFKPGAINRPTPFAAPGRRAPVKGELVYALDAARFKSSDSGGVNTWRTRFSHGRVQDANKEVGYYTDPVLHPGTLAFEVRDGALVLRAERFAKPRTFGDRVMSYGASVLQAAWLSQQYGYYEVEAQTSSARGTWSAFWLLPADGSWPPEIDVFEHPRNGQIGPDKTTVAHHWGPQSDRKSMGATLDLPRLLGRPIDLTSGFHTYAVDWRADYTTWFVDGEEVFRTPTRFHKPAFPLLDVAVGGWGGTPDFSTGTTEMKVKALRIYR